MATKVRLDLEARQMQEIAGFLTDMIGEFDREAMAYALAYFRAQRENTRNPPAPQMHSFMAKAIREVVNDVLADTRRMGRVA